jgi:hypothetical protein
MEWLRDHGFRAISMRQVFERGTAEFPPERTVVLTFDDGLANFAETAWPVLRDMSFSATAYVPTDFIGADAAWYPSYGLPRLPCMAWGALRGVQREGADVQSHAGSHRDLTRLPPGELREELRRSKAVLEDGLGGRVVHLAYPFGALPSVRERRARPAIARSGPGRKVAGEHSPQNPARRSRPHRHRNSGRLSIEACAVAASGGTRRPRPGSSGCTRCRHTFNVVRGERGSCSMPGTLVYRLDIEFSQSVRARRGRGRLT